MHLFTTFKPTFTFKKLSEIDSPALFDECVKLVTLWFTEEWGYIHDKDKSNALAIFDRVEYLLENVDKIQMVFYDKLIVGAFRIEEKEFDKELMEKSIKSEDVLLLEDESNEQLIENRKDSLKGSEIWFIYVDPDCRNLGAGRQIVKEIKRQSSDEMKAAMVLLETLKTGLNRLYLSEGGEIVCENSLEKNETTFIRIDLSS